MGVLIVDDTAFMRMNIKRILTMNNIEVVGEAVDGKDAILKYRELKPEAVTMDITMPEIDGVEATKEILKLDPQAKIIVCSAMGQQSMVLEAIASGAKAFIVKPFTEEKLITEINKLLG